MALGGHLHIELHDAGCQWFAVHHWPVMCDCKVLVFVVHCDGVEVGFSICVGFAVVAAGLLEYTNTVQTVDQRVLVFQAIHATRSAHESACSASKASVRLYSYVPHFSDGRLFVGVLSLSFVVLSCV